MKLEVGMFARTKKLLNYDYVTISKIKHIEEKETCLHIWLEDKDLITEKYIIKASHNIIDLIEPGDLMYIDISPDNYGGIVVPRVAETLSELSYWIKEIKSGRCILKAILTKEQIVNNWYEVGEK